MDPGPADTQTETWLEMKLRLMAMAEPTTMVPRRRSSTWGTKKMASPTARRDRRSKKKRARASQRRNRK